MNHAKESLMEKEDRLRMIRQTGVIAIMRANDSKQLIDAADAIKAGGVHVIEVTMTTPGALKVIEKATERYAESVLLGQGLSWMPKVRERLFLQELDS